MAGSGPRRSARGREGRQGLVGRSLRRWCPNSYCWTNEASISRIALNGRGWSRRRVLVQWAIDLTDIINDVESEGRDSARAARRFGSPCSLLGRALCQRLPHRPPSRLEDVHGRANRPLRSLHPDRQGSCGRRTESTERVPRRLAIRRVTSRRGRQRVRMILTGRRAQPQPLPRCRIHRGPDTAGKAPEVCRKGHRCYAKLSGVRPVLRAGESPSGVVTKPSSDGRQRARCAPRSSSTQCTLAAWTRRGTDLDGLICHDDAGGQDTSIACTGRRDDIVRRPRSVPLATVNRPGSRDCSG